MKRTTNSGLTITYAEFWLDWCGAAPDRYPRVSTERRNARSLPLNRREARDYWGRRCFGVEFSDDATDWMVHILAQPC